MVIREITRDDERFKMESLVNPLNKSVITTGCRLSGSLSR